MRKFVVTSVALCAVILFGADARAQAPAPYGETLNSETAKKAAAAAVEESKKNGWAMCVAVVAPSGDLVQFERMDNCQFGSIVISQQCDPRIPLSGGAGLTALTLDGIIASEGGIPIVIGGKIVGGIGCSGGTGQQDGVACQAGINAVK